MFNSYAILLIIFLLFQNLSVSVSVLTLTFIAYDRYNAICRPLQFSTRKTKAAVVIGKSKELIRFALEHLLGFFNTIFD